jgi:hypothetical protein
VKTGNLRQSGYKVNVTEGCKIGYAATYAQSVHEGTPVKSLGGTEGELVVGGKKTGYKERSGDVQTIHVKAHGVKAHTRRATSGRKYEAGVGPLIGPYTVKAHTRTYIGKRLVSMATKGEPGVFKVVYHTGGQKPQPFLSDAIKQEMHWLPEDVAFYLRSLGSAKVK